jgi:hypothetical protein
VSKYVAHGTSLKIGNTRVGGLITISIPDRSRGEAEITDSDSTDRKFIAAMRDPGSCNITVRHDPDDPGQNQIDANFNAAFGSEVVTWVITLPGAATASPSPGGVQAYTFDGYVAKPFSGDLDLVGDKAAELTATVRVSGPVVIT